jgi:14-3-3 protein
VATEAKKEWRCRRKASLFASALFLSLDSFAKGHPLFPFSAFFLRLFRFFVFRLVSTIPFVLGCFAHEDSNTVIPTRILAYNNTKKNPQKRKMRSCAKSKSRTFAQSPWAMLGEVLAVDVAAEIDGFAAKLTQKDSQEERETLQARLEGDLRLREEIFAVFCVPESDDEKRDTRAMRRSMEGVRIALNPTDFLRLACDLELSCVLSEEGDGRGAVELAKRAFDDAILELDPPEPVGEEEEKNATTAVQLLRANLANWTSDGLQEGENVHFDLRAILEPRLEILRAQLQIVSGSTTKSASKR